MFYNLPATVLFLNLFVSLVVADGRDLAVRPHDARVVGSFGYRHLTAVERSASVVVSRLNLVV